MCGVGGRHEAQALPAGSAETGNSSTRQQDKTWVQVHVGRCSGSSSHLDRQQQSPWKEARIKEAAAGWGSRGGMSRHCLSQCSGLALPHAAGGSSHHQQLPSTRMIPMQQYAQTAASSVLQGCWREGWQQQGCSRGAAVGPRAAGSDGRGRPAG